MGKVLTGVGCLFGASVVVRLFHDRRQQAMSARRAIAASTNSMPRHSPDVVSAARQAGDELAAPTGSLRKPARPLRDTDVRPGGESSLTPDAVAAGPSPHDESSAGPVLREVGSRQERPDEAPRAAGEGAGGEPQASPGTLAGLSRQALFDIAKDHNVPAGARLMMTREELIEAISLADA